jgi:hypothetical protein
VTVIFEQRLNDYAIIQQYLKRESFSGKFFQFLPAKQQNLSASQKAAQPTVIEL